MSQPGAALTDLSTTDQELFTQAQLDQFFNQVGYDQIAYSQDFSEAAGGFDLQQYYTPPESAAATPASTPDFYDYNFGPIATEYPTPGPNTPHPYPIEQQQCLDPTQDVNLAYPQRPQLVRSHANTSHLQPSQPPPGYTRRRSLSQGDVDHITALNAQVPNPTFMRLQTPRARSESPGPHAYKRRISRHSRSTSQETGSRGHHTRDNTPTSVPYYVNGLVPTRIGDPLSPESPRYHRPAAQQQWPVQDGCSENDVVFRHMVRPEQMERSRKIIELGAVALRQQIDPPVERNSAAMLQKLEEVERYLKAEGGGCEAALRGCVTIREALTKNEDMILIHDGASTSQDVTASADTPDAPSEMMSDLVDNLFDDGDSGAVEDTLMDLLVQENATPFRNENV